MVFFEDYATEKINEIFCILGNSSETMKTMSETNVNEILINCTKELVRLREILWEDKNKIALLCRHYNVDGIDDLARSVLLDFYFYVKNRRYL